MGNYFVKRFAGILQNWKYLHVLFLIHEDILACVYINFQQNNNNLHKNTGNLHINKRSPECTEFL